MAKQPRQRDDFRSAEAATRFASAVQLHQAGRLSEAEKHYRQALAADPRHVDSLHLLGVLAHQVGHSQAAVELIGKALALNERVPEFHYHAGLACGALGRFAEAAAHNRRAVALRPDYAEAHLNLGNALNAQGACAEALASYRRALALRPSPEAHYNIANALAASGNGDDAIAHYRHALALRPGYAEALTNLGAALMAQGRAAEAAELHREALALKPELATALVNLGNALRAQGRYGEAIDNYRAALGRDPNHAEAHNNLGAALLARDQLAQAAACFRRALALKPELTAASVNLARASIGLGDLATGLELAKRLLDAGVAEARALFFFALRAPQAAGFAAPCRAELIRALTEPWGNPRVLAGLAAELLKADATIAALTRTGTIGFAEIAMLARDGLLAALLESVQVNDIDLERLLTATRHALLNSADQVAAHDVALAFACALARQCFINEYVFACTESESRRTRFLRDALAAALRESAQISPGQLVALACYIPLHTLPGARTLLARDWPEPVRALLAQQVGEPMREAQIRITLPRLTDISAAVSQAVRAQYEENPYPRWTRIAATGKPQPVEAYLRDRFPLAPIQPLGRPARDYLIAGCGSGQQVAGAMLAFSGLDVTAIDLSLASLGYAKRMTDALGLRVAYGQADILELASLGKSFDVVDSAGVLHHMADPLAGWRVLVSLLRPRGLMRIALYSTIARKDITAARRFIAQRGWPATADGIRTARQAILALPDGAPEKNAATPIDFFSLSDCRDLLFHVQEHTFGIPAIAKFLKDNALEFLGFEVAPHVARQYAERFPGDAAKTELDNWNLFEQDNPDTFIATLEFWTQKRDSAAQ